MDTSETGPSTSSRARGRRGAATPAAPEQTNVVMLGPRDSLVGTLTVDGDVRIEGTVDGEVTATGEVSVHAGGTARAQISARDIVVMGAVEGTVVAGELRRRSARPRRSPARSAPDVCASTRAQSSTRRSR